MKPVDNLITLSYICMILYCIKLKNPAVFDMLSNFVNSFSSQLPPLKKILNILTKMRLKQDEDREDDIIIQRSNLLRDWGATV